MQAKGTMRRDWRGRCDAPELLRRRRRWHRLLDLSQMMIYQSLALLMMGLVQSMEILL